ncbi:MULTISPECIES: ABC transporter permease [unclassified Bacillus (in: firmicutes)]|uniref:ABC transporter permease n=1 Tax=unclassified Bacillus (in: firmicutes) TaxID=185979 RepID=UPI0030007E51
MRKFLAKRLMQLIPVLFIISFIVFGLVYVAGDPVTLMLPEEATAEEKETLREALGLNKPFIVQYGIYVLNLLQGDFGESFRYNTDALSLVLERVPATLELAFYSMLIAVIIAIPLGILSATRKNSIIDVFASSTSVLGKALPNFWMGIMLILLFAVNFKLFPVSGRGTFAHVILPAVTLGTGIAAEITRLVRSNVLEILQQDYIKTARSKGLREFFVVYKHAFKNASIPVITIMALQTSSVVSGALVTETVFAWPGIGQLIVQSVNGRDMAVVQAAVFVIAIMVISINLITDILYRLVDPRIKY